MDLKLLTPATAAALHSRIAECLEDDDNNVQFGQQRRFCCRDTADWKQMADELEEVLRSKSISFKPIDWRSKTLAKS